MHDAASFSFVHAADLHLDTPFSGVQEVAPAVARALRDASLAAFESVVTLAIDRRAAFVLFAGDIYDGPERGLRAQLVFRDGLERLEQAGIATFVVHGNHDPVEHGWSALGGGFAPGVTVFGAHGVGVVPVWRDGLQIATVQGISYARRETTENLALDMHRPEGPGVHIGLLHCNVEGGASGHANYAPCTVSDLRATRLDYLALGHIHERRILAEGSGPGDPWVVYPGNTQARSPRHSEGGAKGAYVVEVCDGVIQPPEFVACDRIRFAELSCPIGELADLGELEAELRELAAGAGREAEGRSLILRATLTGRGELHGDLGRERILDEVLGHLRERGGTGEPFLWWDSVRDESSGVIDLEELRRRGDFTSDLLDVARAAEKEEGDLLEFLEQLVAEAPRPLRHRLETLFEDPDRRRSVLAEALGHALDELDPGR